MTIVSSELKTSGGASHLETCGTGLQFKAEAKIIDEYPIINHIFTNALSKHNFPKMEKKRKYGISLPWETEAVKVIKEKIEHYKETGNARKLGIYEAKLKQKMSIIGALKSTIKCD